MEEESENVSPRQLDIPGTEPDYKNDDIERALDAWLDAKDEQKGAGEATKLRHSALLIQMADAGAEQYPYIERSTGKKKWVVIARDPKAKTISAPRGRSEPEDVGDEVETPKEDDRVEHRKVSRASVEDEIDPFAKTRAKIEEHHAGDGLLGDAERAQNGEKPKPAVNGHNAKPKRPSKRKAKR